MQLNDEDVVTALEEMSRHLDVRLLEVESLKEDLDCRVMSQENALSIMKIDLQRKRLLNQTLTQETSEMEQTYRTTLKGVTSKKSRMTAEKKVLVTEIKSLRLQQSNRISNTEKYTKEYYEKYQKLNEKNIQNEGEEEYGGSTGSKGGRRNGERALDDVRMLRSALTKLASKRDPLQQGMEGESVLDSLEEVRDSYQQEIEITRVQALIGDVGINSPHQELVIHLRELLNTGCNLQMQYVSNMR